MSLCLSCSSPTPTASSSVFTSRTAPFLTPCCSSPICASCIRANPRLRTYVPCLKCGDGVGRSKAPARSGARRTGPVRREIVDEGGGASARADRVDATGGGSDFGIDGQGPEELDDRFALGDSDSESDIDSEAMRGERRDSGDDQLGRSGSKTRESSPPPGYTIQDGAEPSSSSSAAVIPHAFNTASETTTQTSIIPEETERLKHLVKRGETLRSVASRYAMDPSDLLDYNDLPHTCLSFNPGLIQTRRYLYLQPSSTSATPPPGPPFSSTTSPETFTQKDVVRKERDSAKEKQRQEERRLKRFQLVTKEVDTGVARTYLALQSMGEGGSGSGEGEVLFDAQEEDSKQDALPRYAESHTQSTHMDEKSTEKSHTVLKRAKEESAMNHFFDDDAWEETQRCSSSLSKTTAGGLLASIGLRQSKPGETRFKTGERVVGAPFIGGGSGAVSVGGSSGYGKEKRA